MQIFFENFVVSTRVDRLTSLLCLRLPTDSTCLPVAEPPAVVVDRHVVQVRNNCPSRALRETCDQASISKTATVFWRAAAKRNWTREFLVSWLQVKGVSWWRNSWQTNKRTVSCLRRAWRESLSSRLCSLYSTTNRDVSNLTSTCVNFLHILTLWRPAILTAIPPRKAKKTYLNQWICKFALGLY